MSYCRFVDSDVYMYSGSDGAGNQGIICCCCSLGEQSVGTGPLVVTLHNRQDALNHLHEHRLQGDNVPEYAFRRLTDEIRLFGPDPSIWNDEVWLRNTK